MFTYSIKIEIEFIGVIYILVNGRIILWYLKYIYITDSLAASC